MKKNTADCSPYLQDTALAYARNKRDNQATVRELRDRFPDFDEGNIPRWMTRNTRGFRDMVEQAEAALGPQDELDRATDARVWTAGEIKDLQPLLTYAKERLQKAIDGDGKRPRKARGRSANAAIAKFAQIFPFILKGLDLMIRLHGLQMKARNPPRADVARAATRAMAQRLIALATPEQRDILRDLVARACGRGVGASSSRP